MTSDDERTPCSSSCEEDGCSLLLDHGGDLHIGPVQDDGTRICWAMEHSVKKITAAFGGTVLSAYLSLPDGTEGVGQGRTL